MMREKSRWSRRSVGAALAAGALLATGCAADAPLDSLSPAGPQARMIDDLWQLVFWLAVAVFVIVEGLIVVAMIKFRQRKGDTEAPKQTHGNTRLEVAWTIGPALLLAALAFPTIATLFALAREPEDALEVTVTAHQWWWEYTYAEEGIVTANELHIPAGRPVFLTLESGDVIHSYWVPRLAGKIDLVPGRTNHLTIEADEPGEYHGTCAEYCGLSHANMRFRVFAHTDADYQRWVESQLAPPVGPTTALEEQGKIAFETGQCIACHAIEGVSEGREGPDLTHFASRTTFAGSIFKRTDEHLAEWLRDPPGVKPGSLMPNLGLEADEIAALVAYLQSLE